MTNFKTKKDLHDYVMSLKDFTPKELIDELALGGLSADDVLSVIKEISNSDFILRSELNERNSRIKSLQKEESKAYLEHQISIREKGRNNPETKAKYSKWYALNDKLFDLGAKPDETLSDNKKGYIIQVLNEGSGESLNF